MVFAVTFFALFPIVLELRGRTENGGMTHRLVPEIVSVQKY